jgi:hypothetical protein
VARSDPEFRAAICSLGLLGVLTRVRFSVVDELYFDVVQKIVDMDDALRRVPSVRGSDAHERLPRGAPSPAVRHRDA